MSSNVPIVSAIGSVVGDVMDVLNQKPPAQAAAPQAPTTAAANDSGLAATRAKLARNRTYRTLFTGGQGVLERASTASTTLLGI